MYITDFQNKLNFDYVIKINFFIINLIILITIMKFIIIIFKVKEL